MLPYNNAMARLCDQLSAGAGVEMSKIIMSGAPSTYCLARFRQP